MQITVIAVLCHTIGIITPESVDTLQEPVCREVIVIKDEMPMQALHAFAAFARRLERAVDLSRRSMADQAYQMFAGRLRSERTGLKRCFRLTSKTVGIWKKVLWPQAAWPPKWRTTTAAAALADSFSIAPTFPFNAPPCPRTWWGFHLRRRPTRVLDSLKKSMQTTAMIIVAGCTPTRSRPRL
jgi:hypothetical protein